MALSNYRNVIEFDSAIENTFRFDNDDRSLFTESVATAKLRLDGVTESLLGYVLLKCIENPGWAGRVVPSGCRTGTSLRCWM